MPIDHIRITALHLRKEEREERPGDAAPKEDWTPGSSQRRTRNRYNKRLTPQDAGRADGLAELVERERGDDGPGLPACSGHPVRGRSELGREDLGGIRVRRRVRAEVEEELQEREADDERRRAQRVELASEDADW